MSLAALGAGAGAGEALKALIAQRFLEAKQAEAQQQWKAELASREKIAGQANDRALALEKSREQERQDEKAKALTEAGNKTFRTTHAGTAPFELTPTNPQAGKFEELFPESLQTIGAQPAMPPGTIGPYQQEGDIGQATPGKRMFLGGPDYMAQQETQRAKTAAAEEAGKTKHENEIALEKQRAADREAQIQLAASLRPPNTAAGDRSYQYHRTALDRLETPLLASQDRLTRVTEAINQRTPQADALVAPELLTVMAGGQGSGMRMNEAEIARIVGGRTAWEGIKASLNRWQTDPSKGLSITDAQRQQIHALIGTVQKRLGKKLEALDAAGQDLMRSQDERGHRQLYQKARQRLSQIDREGEGATGGGTFKIIGSSP